MHSISSRHRPEASLTGTPMDPRLQEAALAVRTNNRATIERLLRAGLDPNARIVHTDDGYLGQRATLSHMAVARARTLILKTLLEYGADPDVRSEHGVNVVEAACLRLPGYRGHLSDPDHFQAQCHTVSVLIKHAPGLLYAPCASASPWPCPTPAHALVHASLPHLLDELAQADPEALRAHERRAGKLALLLSAARESNAVACVVTLAKALGPEAQQIAPGEDDPLAKVVRRASGSDVAALLAAGLDPSACPAQERPPALEVAIETLARERGDPNAEVLEILVQDARHRPPLDPQDLTRIEHLAERALEQHLFAPAAHAVQGLRSLCRAHRLAAPRTRPASPGEDAGPSL